MGATKAYYRSKRAQSFAILLGLSSLGAAAACVAGRVDLLLPADVFGQLNPLAGSLLAIQCFAIGVLSLCSVANDYAPSQLKFHALGLLPVIALAISFGFWANVVQNVAIGAICAYLGFTHKEAPPAEEPARWKNDPPRAAEPGPVRSSAMAVVLMGINLVLLVGFCATPFFMTVDELFPQFEGKVTTLTFHMCIASTVVYVVPLAGAVLTNKASQVQPWWAACLFFNTATHMMMRPIDTQNALSNGVLAVLHLASCLFFSAKAPKSRTG